MTSPLDRRKFLSHSGAGLAAGLILPTARFARAAGANERIRVGVIGCGGRGGWVLSQLEKNRDGANVTVSAVCDVWKPAREKMAARVEKNFGARPKTFARFGDVLDRDDIDAVVITTPDFAHSPILAAAARAKKDAYCEKPMANTLADANDALRAVRENGTVTQIGTQRRSDGHFAAAAAAVQGGLVGKVVQIDTAWHDHNPRWNRSFDDVREADVDWEQYQMGLERRPFDPRRYRCWHLYQDYTVGTPGLLGSHLIDAATWMVGDPYPKSATALGGTYVWKEREHADTMECLWEFPTGFLMRYGTRLANSNRPAEVTVYGTRGTFDTASWTATPQGGGREKLAATEKIQAGKSEDHVRNWLDCIRSRKDPNATIEMGHAHSVATIMAYQSWLTGRTQIWDGDNLTFGSAG